MGLRALACRVLGGVVSGLATLAVASAADGPPALPAWLLFSGFDASSQAYAAWAGLDYAPGGLDADGLRLRAVATAGGYRTSRAGSSALDTTVAKQTATAAVGHAWITPTRRIALFAGGEFDSRDPGGSAAAADRGQRGGAYVAAELWTEPVPGVQVAASASAGTARSAWAVRATACRVIGTLCLGPDVAALGDETGSEVRLGLGVSGLTVGPIKMRLAGGYAAKDDGTGGPYGFVSLWQRF